MKYIWCETCFYNFHYDKDGTKSHSFQAKPFIDPAIIYKDYENTERTTDRVRNNTNLQLEGVREQNTEQIPDQNEEQDQRKEQNNEQDREHETEHVRKEGEQNESHTTIQYISVPKTDID